MLRNYQAVAIGNIRMMLLNEVLSLNAQESIPPRLVVRAVVAFLNEVLSLNAQEYTLHRPRGDAKIVLNEVLSLNAQEFPL